MSDGYEATRRASKKHIWPHLGRKVDFRAKVRVYRNLRRTSAAGGPVYSIVQSGLVVAHSDALMLSGGRHDCTFVVQRRGRERARREGRRNVHAFVEGKISLCGAWGITPYACKALPVKVAYDHRDDRGFRSVDFIPRVDNIRGATSVCLNELGMSATYLT